MQFAQILNGTTTSWTDLVGGGRDAITVTTNVSTYYRIRPFDGLLRNGTVDGTRYTSVHQFTTLGVSTNLQRAYVFRLQAYTNGAPLATYLGITIKGKPLDAYGRVVLTLPDNTRQIVTPVFPAALSNAAYYPPTYTALDMDVIHPVTYELSETDEAKRGGLVAVRRDFNSPVTVLRLRGWSELAGSVYKLDWNSSKIRIWQDAGRTIPVNNGSTSFPADWDTDIYLEGLTKSATEKDVLVNMRVTIGGVQSIAQQVPLTVVDAEFIAILRIFIPYDWVKIPWHPFHTDHVAQGDARDYAPDLSGTHRVMQTSVITPFPDLSPSGFKLIDGMPQNQNSGGESRHYKWSTSLNSPEVFSFVSLPVHSGLQVNGRPGFLTPLALADNYTSSLQGDYLVAVAQAKTDEMYFSELARTKTETTVRLFGAAKEELVFLAADIDWDFQVTVSIANPIAPRFRLKGKQDGFPAYEMYIKRAQNAPVADTTIIYQWKPPLNRDVMTLTPAVGNDETLGLLEGAIK